MTISGSLRRQVVERANNRCENCGLSQAGQGPDQCPHQSLGVSLMDFLLTILARVQTGGICSGALIVLTCD